MKKCVLIFGAALVPLLVFFLVFLAVLSPFRGLTGGTDYEEALSKSEKLYEKRKEEFRSAKELLLKDEPTDTVKIHGVESIVRHNGTEDHTPVIEFTTGNQGLMTGGQYWGLYYTSNDKPADPFGLKEEFQNGPYAESHYYSKPDEHIFYATEKIEEYWYFYYMDYDGNRHGLDW